MADIEHQGVVSVCRVRFILLWFFIILERFLESSNGSGIFGRIGCRFDVKPQGKIVKKD